MRKKGPKSAPFLPMEDDLYRTTVQRFLDQTWKWRVQFDQIVADYWQEMRKAIEVGNAERVNQLNESYAQRMEAAGSAYLSGIDPKEAKGKKRILDAIILFRLLYFLLEIDRPRAYREPLLTQGLAALEEGKSDPELGPFCTELSKALREKMAETRPPLYDGTLEFLLQEYESWLKRIQRIWKKHPRGKLYGPITAEFPIIRDLNDTGRYVGDFTPQFIALNIIAPRKSHGQSNVHDLRRALVKARKIRKALEPLGIEFAAPMSWLSELQ